MYLGYNVSVNGISVDPSKVEAVRDFPPLKDVSAVRSFLGLTSYYCRFISGFSKIAESLFSLTRKGIPFQWNDKSSDAVQKLKELLTNTPLMIFPKFDRVLS